MIRWCVDIRSWNPIGSELKRCLRPLPSQERERCQAFVDERDRSRAIVSRLLQRRVVHRVMGIPYTEIELERTKGNKPFLPRRLHNKVDIPNFNFNVAHEVDRPERTDVFLTFGRIGVLCCFEIRDSRRSIRRTRLFEKILTNYELETMVSAAQSDEELETFFQRYWALKEAFVKARGDGIAFGVRNAEFDFGSDIWNDSPRLRVAGATQENWSFKLHRLECDHWVAVAKGPPQAIVDDSGDFKKTFDRPFLNNLELHMELSKRAEPSFEQIPIETIVEEAETHGVASDPV